MLDAIWDDGEWISWYEINEQIQYKEWRAKYPNANLELVPIFEQLIELAEQYHEITGNHLSIYGDIGEVYGAITHGIKLHRNYAQGSDGRVGDDFVEVKTITPFKKNDTVLIKRSGHFSKVFIVKINRDFQVSGRLIDRSDLPKGKGKIIRLRWNDIAESR